MITKPGTFFSVIYLISGTDGLSSTVLFFSPATWRGLNHSGLDTKLRQNNCLKQKPDNHHPNYQQQPIHGTTPPLYFNFSIIRNINIPVRKSIARDDSVPYIIKSNHSTADIPERQGIPPDRQGCAQKAASRSGISQAAQGSLIDTVITVQNRLPLATEADQISHPVPSTL